MAFKFPFTNYHELNLTWVLEQLKKLFEESEENVETIETYDNRLSAVESEVSTLETTTSQAINTANAAATNAATALSRANTANENALTAGSQAGAAVTAAQDALQEAQAATQAAQQAQATAMTFDGRITQAQNDASAAVHEAESFENRVNAAINTANNAANTATIAQGIAVNANQTAAQALDELNAQRDELESIAAGLIDDINDEADAEKQDIQNLANSVIASIPSDYTQLSADVKNKAPVIVANASGEIASFKDGANDMELRHLLATINPIQAGSGEPSPSNIRSITGRTGLSGKRTGKNLANPESFLLQNVALNSGIYTYNPFTVSAEVLTILFSDNIFTGKTITVSFTVWATGTARITLDGQPDALYTSGTAFTDRPVIANTTPTKVSFTGPVLSGTTSFRIFRISTNDGAATETVYVKDIQIEINSSVSDFEPYEGDTISVNWQTEAGTVYGGTLDVVIGELSVNYAMIDLGTLGWNKTTGASSQIARFFTNNLMNVIKKVPNGTVANGLCEIYKIASANQGYAGDVVNCITVDSAGSVSCYPTESYIDVTAFQNAVSGIKFVYELATSQTYQLTPQEINTLLGNNIIYTDCGPVSVDYPTDTKLYIDGKFAELQALVLEN